MSCIIVSPIEFLLWCGMYQLSLCILNPVDHMQSNVFFFFKKREKIPCHLGLLQVPYWFVIGSLFDRFTRSSENNYK